jgi:hypothetical protein
MNEKGKVWIARTAGVNPEEVRPHLLGDRDERYVAIIHQASTMSILSALYHEGLTFTAGEPITPGVPALEYKSTIRFALPNGMHAYESYFDDHAAPHIPPPQSAGS